MYYTFWQIVKIMLVLSFWCTSLATANEYTVTNTSTAGNGSLQWAIQEANSNSGADSITFDIPLSLCDPFYGVCTIRPTALGTGGNLPTLLDDSTTINGYTQPGASSATSSSPADLKIRLDGTIAGTNNGMNIGSDNNTVKGLIISHFSVNGIYLFNNASGNEILGNYIGTNFDGTGAQGNGLAGIYMEGGANTNFVGIPARYDFSGEPQCHTYHDSPMPEHRNLISGNGAGVGIYDTGTDFNCVNNNYIGTDAEATSELGNTLHGVYIYGGASSNLIFNNTIGGNGEDGVRILGEGTDNTTITANKIGLLLDAWEVVPGPLHSLGNTGNGINCMNGPEGTQISLNLIGFNTGHGIHLQGVGTAGNFMVHNFIGLFDLRLITSDPSETHSFPNLLDGIHISDGASDNGIGSILWLVSDFFPNLIALNRYGIQITGVETTGNTVVATHIGTNGGGTTAYGNTVGGILITGGSYGNTIGGPTKEEANLISGNSGNGIHLWTTMGNIIQGNSIGTSLDQRSSIANTGDGIALNAAENNTIAGNTIANSGGRGLSLMFESNKNSVQHNLIGINATGTVMGNNGSGIFLQGTTFPIIDNNIGPGNTIANNNAGVVFKGAQATKNIIFENSIHDNTGMGIDLQDGANELIVPPIIAMNRLTPPNVTGTSCGGCTVEVFANPTADGEGQIFLGRSTANPGGDFTIPVTSFPHAYLTATATNNRNTSEFSTVFEAELNFPWILFMPAIQR